MLPLLLLTLAVIFIFHQCYWRRLHLPAGPMPLPIIGNLLSLDANNIDNQLMEYKKQYGNVFTLWLANPTVIVGGHEAMKAIFIKNGDKVVGRQYMVVFEDLYGGMWGIANASDGLWKSQRRFFLHVLRDFGVGKPLLENAIITQAAEVCTYFKSLNGEPITLTKTFSTAVGNIIYQLMFNTTVSLEEDTIYKNRHDILEISRVFHHPFTLLSTIWEPLKYFRFHFVGASYHDKFKPAREMEKDFVKRIAEHRATIDYDGDPRDYIDAFLFEQRKHNPTLQDNVEWSDRQLIATILDVFSAGFETTGTTLEMFVLYMLYNPDVQTKIHEELDRVIGRDKTISMLDQSKLPYFNACMQEVQRCATVIPLNLFHRASEDIHYNGFVIPKGTSLIPQYELIHKDEKEFPDPMKFDPERFLDSNKNFVKDERVTPFSVGKRNCAGEALGRMELFLFAATFFQHFEFKPVDPNHLPPFEFEYSLAKSIKPFHVRIIERK